MANSTTTLEISLNRQGRNMSVQKKRAISRYIDAAIVEFKDNNEIMNQAALECAVKLSKASSISSELANQGFIKNIYRTVTGKNRKLKSTVTKSMADSQYAAQLMLVKLREQNELTMDVVANLDRRNNIMFLEVDNQLLKANKNIDLLYDSLLAVANKVTNKIDEVAEHALTACSHCGSPMSYSGILCPVCGEINDNSVLEFGVESNAYIKEKAQSLQNALKDANNCAIDKLWNEKVTDYAKRISACRRILSTDGIRSYIPGSDHSGNAVSTASTSDDNILSTGKNINLFEQMDEFIEECKDAMFQVAIVGTVKAGKSTLINALLGDTLASTAVTPETSVLAQFCNSKDSDYIKITFYTTKEWEELTKSGEGLSRGFVEQFNEHGDPSYNKKYINKKSKLIKVNSRDELKRQIEKWTDSETPEHFYVSEVLIGIKDSVLPEGILLVDTPGLNDPVEYRSAVTRKYIREADAVIACINAKNIENSDIKFIGQIQTNLETSNLNNVFIVATQIDTLNDPLKDWEEQKRHFIRTLSVLYKDTPYEDILPFRLFGVTAYLQNYINRYRRVGGAGIAKAVNEDFIFGSILFKYRVRPDMFVENIDKLESYTGIEMLLSEMQNYLFSNYKEHLISSIEVRYEKLYKNIIDVLEKIISDQKKIIQTGKSDVKKINQEIIMHEHEISQLKSDKNDFDDSMKALKKGLDEIYIYVKDIIERG